MAYKIENITKTEKMEDVKMVEDMKTIQAGDLVVVIDDSECSEIKNGDIHQVNRVYKNSITLVGKVGVNYYTKRFKKVYSSQTSSPEKRF